MKPDRAGRTETLLSLAVLGILVAVAIGVWRAQFDFYPAVRMVAETASEAPLLAPLPAGVRPFSPLETFGPETLADKINGKAALYLPAGFEALRAQRFTSPALGEGWLEVFVYDMGSSQNAHAVYSVQRRDGAEPLDLVRYAYRTANALFLVHGPFYVEVVAAGASEAAGKAVDDLARAFVRQTPVEADPAEAAASVPDLFPAEGLAPSSVRQLARDAFGLAGFDRVYTADYGGMSAFISRRDTPAEARALLGAYFDFLTAFGGEALESPVPGARLVHIMGTYELFQVQGPYLFGVRQGEDPAAAAALVKEMAGRLAEGAP